MEPPTFSPDPTPPDHPSPSPAKRSAWKHPAPNGPAVMDANHWPALSEAAKNTNKLAPSPDSTRPPESSSPSPAPVAASSATPNSSNSHKHASGTHHGRHKPARRGAAAGEHSPRDHPDRSTGGWDHATGAAGGRGAHRNHNNGGARRGNGTTAAAAGSGGGFANRRRGGYEPFYRGPPPMGMGPYMRGAPPPPPPMTVPPPFMGPPPPPASPMRPFAGPMVFHDMQSPVSPVSPIYFYGPPPPPEALRGLALAPPMVGPPAYPYFQAPSEPQPEPEPEPQPDAEEERTKLLNQIEFYFSKENLCSDVYLRQQMDGHGWVDISLIAGFKKVQELTKDLQYVKEIVQSSSILEMQGAKIRKQNDWEKWVIPRESNPDIPSSSASVARPNVNNLTAHLGGMGLHESASSSSTVEQNHHDVIQNGSPSGNDEAPVTEDNSGHHQQLLE
ncbi:hypothetical protein PAHAL_9G002900 [Panicum hallii]|uniref:HTH La-type RNA-binding domain-containing protein n=1 Tax=Panicum hallii TaxID=206008 RepID=A0A2S3IG01_9POAL|nr:la-related protein 1B-like [Panicum hallii]PAN43917.1 hypothetical protein PAHAL_9G002900 [Panicum hallii]